MTIRMCVDDRGRDSSIYSPLEEVAVVVEPRKLPKGCKITVTDGAGREYVRQPASGIRQGVFSFVARGALGCHVVSIGSGDNPAEARCEFRLDARTSIEDGRGYVKRFYDIMESEIFPEVSAHVPESTRFYVDGKVVRFYVHWMRDDTHNKKAFKYWEPEVKSLPELFLDMQRPNGMVYDLFNYPIEHGNYHRYNSWGDDFAGFSKDGRIGWCRIPVEADVEYLTVESVYVSWQATGDDRWMERMLPRLEKALDYMMSSPLRWSEEVGLCKRGFTIDTWDFQHRAACRLSDTGGKNRIGLPDHMWVDEGTHWCIMHGDNSGMYQACRQMQWMYEYLLDGDKAAEWREKAEGFRARTNEVCWNGRFYTHQVHLEPLDVDLGVDEGEQLSLSNAYDMTRGLPSHEQCCAIIEEYMDRREKTDAFAEWFTIDPPFGDLWGGHCRKGSYMNGSITTIVAGELARAAFWHGYERYGADIIQRLVDLQKRDGHLHVAYHPTPLQDDWVDADYATVDLSRAANRDFDGSRDNGWTGEGAENDLRDCPTGEVVFEEVPFVIADPKSNRGRGCVMLQGGPLTDLPEEVRIPVGRRKAATFWFLHTVNWATRGKPVAEYLVEYADGTRESADVRMGRDITGWWTPRDTPNSRAVYHGANDRCKDVGFNMFGWANPHPEKAIKAVVLRSVGNGAPIVIGLTLSSGPVRWPRGWVSYGIPDNWGSAAVLAAVVEGLAGVTDNTKVFEDATIAPRWQAFKESKAHTVVRYGASGGYVAYDYRADTKARKLEIDFTGSGHMFRFHVLLPRRRKATSVTFNGRRTKCRTVHVEKSPYVDFDIDAPIGGKVVISYE